MFIGEYTHTLDEKGRIAVPARFRSYLKKGSVVTRGLDGALVVYPRVEWQKIAVKLAHLPIAQASTRAFARLMLSGAMDASQDRQGRIMLPEYLRDYARIKKQAVVAGLFNRIEIWNKERWKKYRASTEKDSNRIAEQLHGLGV